MNILCPVVEGDTVVVIDSMALATFLAGGGGEAPQSGYEVDGAIVGVVVAIVDGEAGEEAAGA
jgi:hypothetical protein